MCLRVRDVAMALEWMGLRICSNYINGCIALSNPFASRCARVHQMLAAVVIVEREARRTLFIASRLFIFLANECEMFSCHFHFVHGRQRLIRSAA